MVTGVLWFQVDLVVIEGMGRAVHTNLYARFCVSCLKIAVIKNSWLAFRLGGDLFSVIFQYEEYSTESPAPPGTFAGPSTKLTDEPWDILDAIEAVTPHPRP